MTVPQLKHICNFIVIGVDFSFISQCQPIADPVLSKFNPSCYFGAVSENFRALVKNYIKYNPDNKLIADDDNDDEQNSHLR